MVNSCHTLCFRLYSPGIEERESMPTDINMASKPVGLSMNLSKTKVMLNDNAITSTVTLNGNIIGKVVSEKPRTVSE